MSHNAGGLARWGRAPKEQEQQVMGQDAGIMLQSAVSRRAAIATVAGGVGVATAWRGREVHAQTDAAPAPNPVIASWPHVFQHTDFQFQFLLGLGSTYEQAADVGELFAAASQITDGDYDSWYDTFVALGERRRRQRHLGTRGLATRFRLLRAGLLFHLRHQAAGPHRGYLGASSGLLRSV